MKSEKVILLDVDGVVIEKSKVFSIRISKLLNIPLEKVLPFFKNEFQLCLTGEADLKVELEKYIASWGWKGTVDEILKFWFEGEAKLNTEVLDVIKSLKSKGTKVYLATNNEKYRVNYLSKEVGLENYVDGIFSSAGLGFKKPDEHFYIKVLGLLKVHPKAVFFWDDDEENVDGAKKVGINSYLYTDILDIKDYLN